MKTENITVAIPSKCGVVKVTKLLIQRQEIVQKTAVKL